jgi:hypothetical protein
MTDHRVDPKDMDPVDIESESSRRPLVDEDATTPAVELVGDVPAEVAEADWLDGRAAAEPDDDEVERSRS